MRSQFFTALMALMISACASHHRDVASVQDEPETTTQQVWADGISARESNVR
jgi:hypothetical protein